MLFMKRPTPQTRTQKACHGRPRVHTSICASLKKLAEFQKAVEGFLWVSVADKGGAWSLSMTMRWVKAIKASFVSAI